MQVTPGAREREYSPLGGTGNHAAERADHYSTASLPEAEDEIIYLLNAPTPKQEMDRLDSPCFYIEHSSFEIGVEGKNSNPNLDSRGQVGDMKKSIQRGNHRNRIFPAQCMVLRGMDRGKICNTLAGALGPKRKIDKFSNEKCSHIDGNQKALKSKPGRTISIHRFRKQSRLIPSGGERENKKGKRRPRKNYRRRRLRSTCRDESRAIRRIFQHKNVKAKMPHEVSENTNTNILDVPTNSISAEPLSTHSMHEKSIENKSGKRTGLKQNKRHTLKLRLSGMRNSLKSLQKKLLARELHIDELRALLNEKDRKIFVIRNAQATDAVNADTHAECEPENRMCRSSKWNGAASGSYRSRKVEVELENQVSVLRGQLTEARQRECRSLEIHRALKANMQKLRAQKELLFNETEDLKAKIFHLQFCLKDIRKYNKQLTNAECGEIEHSNIDNRTLDGGNGSMSQSKHRDEEVHSLREMCDQMKLEHSKLLAQYKLRVSKEKLSKKQATGDQGALCTIMCTRSPASTDEKSADITQSASQILFRECNDKGLETFGTPDFSLAEESHYNHLIMTYDRVYRGAV